MKPDTVLGVIGGSGLYDFQEMKHVSELEVPTPYGKTSSPIVIGEISGIRVAFLARHGKGHILTPSEVNYRANIYALKYLGVKRIISISACGSLRKDFQPGHIVIPNQLLDMTHKRERSFFGDGLVVHVNVADPYCPQTSRLLETALLKNDAVVHFGGTYITIEGPRFSTKAESNLYRSWGMSIIGMTACPEAFLAREAEICYTTMAHVTDYDVWHANEASVSVDMVVNTLKKNTAIAQAAVKDFVTSMPEIDSCTCGIALKNAVITHSDSIKSKAKEKTAIFFNKKEA